MLEHKRFYALALIFVLSAGSAAAQAAVEPVIGRMVLVRTVGGGEFQGLVLSSSEDRLETDRWRGPHRPDISSIDQVDLSGRVSGNGRLRTRPFLPRTRRKIDSSSCRRLFPSSRENLHITTQEVVVITMSYGVTERLSAWGGISIPGAIANLRYSVQPMDRLAISFGSFAGMTWTSPRAGAVMPYAIASFGVPDRNFTAAAAFPFAVSEDDSPYAAGAFAAFGWKTIVSRTASIIVETWIFYNSDMGRWREIDIVAIPAVAFRIAGGRFSWDIGVFLPTQLASLDTGYAFTGMGAGPFIPLPILSLTYRLR